jgi:PBSX family phage terminase large subunit
MTATTHRVEHRYRPRGTARTVLEDRSPEVLVSGPAGTGKSRACLEKLLYVMKKYPGARGLITRKTLASLATTALDTWRKHVAVDDIGTGEVWYYGGSSEEGPQYRFANGSSVRVGGMDRPTRIMSSEYDIVYAQEATEFTTDDWEAITSRLRNGVMPYQQLLADCNPDAPFHWLYMRCHEITHNGKPACAMYNSTHEENPRLYDEIIDPFNGEVSYVVTEAGSEYMAKLDNLTGVRLQRLRHGLWVAAEGIVFDEWKPGVHLIEPFEIPEHWQRFWAVDFGYTNPFVLQCWAEDDDGRLYLYRELYHTQMTVDQHAQAIMACVSDEDPRYQHPKDAAGKDRPRYAHHGRIWREPRPRTIVCDHDAEGRAQLLRELNMTTKTATKEVIGGIDQVKVRLRNRSDGRPGLFVFKHCRVTRDQSLVDAKKPTCTADEFLTYIWRIGEAGKPTPKEGPVKEGDHGMDALRYLVVYRDPLKRPGLRTT